MVMREQKRRQYRWRRAASWLTRCFLGVLFLGMFCSIVPVQAAGETSSETVDSGAAAAAQAQYEAMVQKVMEDYRELALANWDALTLEQKLMATKTAAKTDEILLVVDHNVTQWQRQPDLRWKKIMDTYCGYGKNGLSLDKREGDMKSPIGSFPILHAFGTKPNPDTAMTYKDVTPKSYWSGEQATYNTWVESDVPLAGEHLIDYYQYTYALAIGYNTDPVVWDRGSAIFFHCRSKDHWYTGGCISVTEPEMIQIVQQSHNGEYIIIVPDEESLKNY